MAPYRVLIVDDSAFMRKIFSDLILKDSMFSIIATATNGAEAVKAVEKWKPDVVTLDLEMPEMNGLEALQKIMKQNPTPVIMLSGISEDNTRDTIKALQFGAFDFIRKPSGIATNDIIQVGEQLIEKLKTAVLARKPSFIEEKMDPPVKVKALDIKKPLITEATTNAASRLAAPSMAKKKPEVTPPIKPSSMIKKPEQPAAVKAVAPSSTYKPTAPPIKASKKTEDPAPPKKELPKSTSFQHIVAIGASTGGPRALHTVISALPGDLGAPVLVVQHMPPKFTKSLAQRLDSFSALHVVEAAQGDRVHPGVVYVAPGGYHLELGKDSSGYYIHLTEQPQRNGHRPSVDVMYESLVPFKELKRHAVILTGMGSDGTKGLKQLVESGAVTSIGEAEETCIVYGMPRSAYESGAVKTVLPLQQIAARIESCVLK
ncbi:chemotaxis-specific protein-glutamate methyltransferase CheB [Paenibacillus algorifonticola]|uniref:protein-glutamate methylesterase/protein-glutamine glutaminase n=1 Tax=Paenibacillus algorifonticola TaxID=684063 RepID=UPI003D27094C